jgi:hypothetical protein
VKGLRRTIFLLGLVSCSNAGELADGVIEIQVIAPSPAIVDFGDTTQYIAVPLNANGDSVGAPVVWMTPDDSTIIIVNPATGLVTGVKPNSQGRVQAVLGALTTGFFTLTILARPDSIILPADSVQTVLADATISAPLLPVLVSDNPAGPTAGHRVIFTIVQPTFADTTGVQSVRLPNGTLTQTATTVADGTPAIGITVSRIADRPTPDTVVVAVTAFQSSGNPVPGSGQRFLVLFE